MLVISQHLAHRVTFCQVPLIVNIISDVKETMVVTAGIKKCVMEKINLTRLGERPLFHLFVVY